jgi:tRNA A-37 threonylcarbamoyl transferase component Bud32
MPTFLAKNIMYKKNDSYEKLVDAMRIIQQYFGPLTYIPKTQLFKEESWHYIIKQESISGEKLTRNLLENNPKLLSKFKRLIIANEIMWLKEWVFLDLLGSDIVTHPQTIHNLITDWENIYIFDFGLLEKHSKSVFFRYFSHFWIWFQLTFLKRFF